MAVADEAFGTYGRRKFGDFFEESKEVEDAAHCISESCNVDQNKPEEDLYPNCDTSIWLRSCSEEILEPIKGKMTGNIPKWLKGTLLRNGPGNFKVGDMTFEHLFDGSALLHRFAIEDGEVTYQSRFVKTQTYKRNMAANRIVVTEFGTKAVPDPCQTIFQRVAALFTPGESMSDNSMISIYPFGDEMYTFTESPVIHRIDPTSLETLQRVNVSKHVGIVNHTSHPHVMKNGTVFNLGLTITFTGPHYAIMKFPPVLTDETSGKQLSMFEQGTIEGTIPARWPFHPAYMHTFGITENYFVIVEQPLSVSVPAMVKSQMLNEPMAANLQWYKDEKTEIHLIQRENGGKFRTFVTEAFFYLHVINSFEEDGHVIIDICCYKDPSMLDCMYVEALKEIQKNPNYAQMFRGRPLRFVLPLKDISLDFDSNENIVTLDGSLATAHRLTDGRIFCQPELLCDLGCETPRIYYEQCLGQPYQYFYAISSDVDLHNPGTLIKVDIKTRQRKTWCEDNIYPSEPIFVPSPNPKTEDDGVVLSALVWGKGLEKQAGMLVLDAKTWTELGRATFTTPSAVPKCLHGWFSKSN